MKTMAARRTAPLLALMFAFAGRAWGEAGFEEASEAGIGALVSQARQSITAQTGKAPAPAAAFLSGDDDRIVPGISLEFYREFVYLSHAAIRIEDNDASFWQLELQGKGEYSSIKAPKFTKLGIKVSVRLIPAPIGDVIIYNDAVERKSVEEISRHQSSSQICRNGEGPDRPLAWYKACLESGARAYTVTAFQYDPLINNCSHFAEKILSQCGLANCQDYPYATGTFHHKGVLAK